MRNLAKKQGIKAEKSLIGVIIKNKFGIVKSFTTFVVYYLPNTLKHYNHDKSI